MLDSETTKPETVILPFQRPIFNRLCTIGRACINVNRAAIGPIKLRTNFLLLGPTGSGKSFLARQLSDQLDVPFMAISISEWILLGCSDRGGKATWPTIYKFIERSKHERGVIIFIDELDKCASESGWNSFLRTEVFSLCDGSVPMNICDSDGDMIPESRILAARNFLVNKAMILGGAAFQNIWEERSKPSMGFLPDRTNDDQPELPDLVQFLPREMINRFSSELFILPELTKSDYRMMVETMAEKISETWRGRFLELGLARLNQAVRHQKGARYLEETLLSAIVMEREALTDFVPTPEPVSKSREDGHEGVNLTIF